MTQSVGSKTGTSDQATDHMFGEAGGTRYDVPIGEMFRMPAADTGSYTARIVAIHQTGDVATAEVAEDGYWGAVSLVDYFSRGAYQRELEDRQQGLCADRRRDARGLSFTRQGDASFGSPKLPVSR